MALFCVLMLDKTHFERVRPLTLIVDDQEEMTLFIDHIAQKCGSRTIIKTGGHAAWETLQSVIPSLLITDWQMPFGDGEWLIRRIKGDPRYRPMKILVVSGTFVDRFLETSWIDSYLSKPFLGEALEHKIQQLLASAFSDATTQPHDAEPEHIPASRRENPRR